MASLIAQRHGPESVRGTLAAVLVFIATLPGCPVAMSQTLNLDAPSAPAAGTGKVTLDLAEVLEKQITRLQKDADEAIGLPDGESRRRVIQLQVSLRMLARNLLRAGEQAGELGSPQVLAGRTLGLRIAGLDRFVATHSSRLSIAVMDRIRSQCSLAAEKLPTDHESLSRFLRDALAPLVGLLPATTLGVAADAPDTPGAGDPDEIGSFPVARPLISTGSLRQAAESAGVSREILDACGMLDARIATAVRWPAYRRSAQSLSRNASDALWLLAPALSPMVSAPARQSLARQFIVAAHALAAPTEADSIPRADDAPSLAARRLRTLALLARCISLASRAEPEQSARALREALANLPLAPDPKTNQPREITLDTLLPERLARLEHQLARLSPPEGGPAFVIAEDLPRQLRPAIKALEDARRQAAGELLESLARAVTSPDIISDPGFLQGISAYRRRLDDLLLLRRVSARIASKPDLLNGAPGTQWVVRKEYDDAADRLLLLARGIASPKDHDVALAEWREYAEALVLLTQEREANILRRATGAVETPLAEHIRVVTGGRADDLLGQLDQARAGWLAEASRARQLQSASLRAAAVRLTAATGAVSLACNWASLRAALATPTPGTAAGDPSTALGEWELSAEAAWVLATADLPSVAAGLLLAADGKLDEFQAGAWERLGSRVRSMLVRVSTLAADRPVHALMDEAADALRQVAMGAEDPDRGDPPVLRSQLRLISRYLEELAGAMARRDTGAAEALERYLDTRINAASAELDRAR